jgi:hypothetical protein
MRDWDQNRYVAQCNQLGEALRLLVGIHNKLAEECRTRFGGGPEEVLLTGYEE